MPLFGQKNDNNWLLCYDGPRIYNFNNDSFQYSGLQFFLNVNADGGVEECRAIISDSLGNYQFLCNGYTVLNKEFRFMKGMTGKCLISPTDTATIYVESGSHLTGAAMILPRPLHSNQYIILHFNFIPTGQVIFSKIYYSTVDMTADSGRGAVISLRNVLDTGNFAQGHFAACKHANGIDWWIVKKHRTENKYYTFLLTKDTIMLTAIQQVGTVCDQNYDAMMSFSSDGSKLAMACAPGYTNLFSFDRCTGTLTLKEYFPTPSPYFPNNPHGGGIATNFSPNSRLLYITQTYITFQFDTWADSVGNTRQIILDTHPDQNSFTLGQLGPNGKIYFGNQAQGSYYGYIESPDSLGIACNPCVHCIDIRPALAPLFIPYFPNFRLKAALGYDTIGTNKSTTTCAGVPIYISTQPYKKHYSYQVSTDGTHYVSINSNEVPVTPTQTTTYYFRTTDNSIDSNCHRNYKVDTVVVNVLPSATNLYQADAGNDTSICPNKTVTLGAANNPANLHYQWFATGQQFSTESHPTVQPAATATYTLRITDPLIDTTCAIKRDTVTVTIEPCPIIIPTLLFNTFKITNLPENATFQLFDLLGRKVFESSNYQNDFDTRILSNGVYLFRFTDAGGSVKKGRVLVIN